MDFKDNSNKPKKSILNTLLLKRSTKVEPHPSSSSSYDNEHNDSDQKNSTYDDHPYRLLSSNCQPNLFQTSVSASSTPIKRLHKIGKLNRLWHCHSSTQSLSSNHSAPSHFLRQINTSTKKKIRNKNDRHSHPISCQNVITDDDEQAYNAFFNVDDNIDSDHIDDIGQSPSNKNTNVRFNSNNGRLIVPRSISNERFSSDDNSCVSKITSKSQEQIIVNDVDESVVCDFSQKRSPTSKSHDGNFTFNRYDDFDFPAGHSIAMSACRSRLRERLLPPGHANHRTQSSNEQQQQQRRKQQQQQQNEQQHCSFPDIVEKSSNSTSSEHRNSRSISCDLITNAKRTGKTESLAKNSLMAAQLINLNLIPTEVARER